MTIAVSVPTMSPTSLRAIIPESGAGVDPASAAHAARLVRDAASALEVQARRIALLERLACSDETTGLLNRRGLMGALSGEMSRSALAGEPVAALLIAVHGLPGLFARIGRRDREEVMRAIADALRRHFVAPARLARIGVGDFVAILPGATLHEARARGTRVGSLITRIGKEFPGIEAQTGAIPVWPGDRPADVLRRLADAEQLARDRGFSPYGASQIGAKAGLMKR
jgi:diguanylate cyclase (GGDEF)-like protein